MDCCYSKYPFGHLNSSATTTKLAQKKKRDRVKAEPLISWPIRRAQDAPAPSSSTNQIKGKRGPGTMDNVFQRLWVSVVQIFFFFFFFQGIFCSMLFTRWSTATRILFLILPRDMKNTMATSANSPFFSRFSRYDFYTSKRPNSPISPPLGFV